MLLVCRVTVGATDVPRDRQVFQSYPVECWGNSEDLLVFVSPPFRPFAVTSLTLPRGQPAP